MVSLQCVSCKSCKNSYMVGFCGKDVRTKKLDGGNFDGVPYVAIGCGELKGALEIKAGDKIPCPNCGEKCIVEDAKPVPTKKHGDETG